MEQSGYVVAIEIGSSKISGIVGKKNSDGNIQVLSYASEQSSSFIKKGMVFNIDKTALSLTNIVNRLEGETHMTVNKVYVGLGGKSMHTLPNSVMRSFDDEVKVTQSLLDEMGRENEQTVYPNLELLKPVPQEYKLENLLIEDPVGVQTMSIEGRYMNIVASSSLKRKLNECLSNAKVEVADFLLAPLCLAESVLSDTDKRSGCVLVDFGADTTTVVIYKNNIMRNLVVLPIGSSNITKDLATLLKMEEDEAEELKLRYGQVIAQSEDSQEEGEKETIQTSREPVDKRYVENIVSARAEEIVANVWNIIQKSGYESQLISGVFVTGGAAELPGLMDLLEKTCKKMKVRRVRNVWSLMMQDCSSYVDARDMGDTLLSLLVSGKEPCCARNTLHDGELFHHEPVEPEQPVQSPEPEKTEQKDGNASTTSKAQEKEQSKEKQGQKKNQKSWTEKLQNILFGEGSNAD